ncbi:hypothetical protein ARSQ2_02483 [Arsenophonus endosymbiont of Bemisia tabaci Q2]|nr:hypothetical protein ARSQ2_02483 [Arsenophonus endosymbiont of Bemisia tabaci Q2]
MRHRYFVRTQYGVIKIKSLSYTYSGRSFIGNKINECVFASILAAVPYWGADDHIIHCFSSAFKFYTGKAVFICLT